MKHLLTLTCVSTLLLATFDLSAKPTTSDISQHEKPATLRVITEKELPGAFLEIQGPHHIYNPLDGTILSRGLLNKKHPVKLEEYGLNWGEKIPGVTHMRIVPLDSQTHVVINGTPYKGCVEISADQNTLTIINEIDIENFLKTTLPSHFTKPLPRELMNAVAILARTHAYYLAAKNTENSFDLDGTLFNYQDKTLVTPTYYIDQAIDTTRHAILTFKGKPFPATWTLDSAGKTASFSTIFRKTALTPPSVTVPLATKNLDDRQWRYVISKKALAEKMQLDNLTSLDLFVDETSDKVYGLKLSSHSDAKEVDFIQFQQLLGKHHLLSNRFTTSLQGDSVIFTGYGKGLGVGLCLHTGHILADKGKTATEILAPFFPHTEIHKVRRLDELK